LLDKWTITKPEMFPSLSATLVGPAKVHVGSALTYTLQLKNSSQYSLNGTQVRMVLPAGVKFAGATGTNTTLEGNELVLTIGRLAAGSEQTVTIPAYVSPGSRGLMTGFATVTSSTALPVFTNRAATMVIP
jgi:uncharacterized repeat protein (TIGR01451 family)